MANNLELRAPNCIVPGAVEFVSTAASTPSQPHRADIALFVGYVYRRRTPLPESVRDWLEENGWDRMALQSRGKQDLDQLRNVPVPIENWESFDQLFEWESRPLEGSRRPIATLLGAAVRSFFMQGGRKCYVVRVEDARTPGAVPLAVAERQAQIQRRIERLLPGYPSVLRAEPANPQDWRGLAHLLGLPDVSFAVLPDLSEIVARHPPRIRPTQLPPPPRPRFEECSQDEVSDPGQDPLRRLTAPRCDETGFTAWAHALGLAAAFLARQRREVQLLAAVPIPARNAEAESDLMRFLGGGADFLNRTPLDAPTGIGSAFVQLAYPWLRTSGSARLPEGLESPDGVLAGILARNALTRGAFRSAGGLLISDLSDVYPAPSQAELFASYELPGLRRAYNLTERVSLFGRTPGGWKLLSDVTASLNESYRPAAVNRLVAVIVRAARRLGEDSAFEISGETVWANLRRSLEDLLENLLQANALRPGYRVHCDRTTMTQADLDSGRLVAEIQFEASLPVERIRIVLALAEGGQLEPAGPERSSP
jgi:uncharacterized protein